MELTNEFEVSVPVAEAWTVLNDLERLAPCLPGAQLEEVEGDEYRGVVKVKVGPIKAQYKGTARITEADEAARTLVVSASGRDTRGQGNASATIEGRLTEHDGHTHVSVLTDLTITGKVAQFGRGVLGDVSAKLMDEFAQNLETSLQEGGEAASADAAGASGAGPATVEARPVAAAEAEPVDLLETAGTPVLKRVLPALGAIIAVFAFGYLWRRRRRPNSES